MNYVNANLETISARFVERRKRHNDPTTTMPEIEELGDADTRDFFLAADTPAKCAADLGHKAQIVLASTWFEQGMADDMEEAMKWLVQSLLTDATELGVNALGA